MKYKSLFFLIAVFTFWIIISIIIHDREIEHKYKNKKQLENSLYSITEQGYYEGQRDALNGDIRIILVKDTIKDTVKWVWKNSPWDNGRKPVFKP